LLNNLYSLDHSQLSLNFVHLFIFFYAISIIQPTTTKLWLANLNQLRTTCGCLTPSCPPDPHVPPYSKHHPSASQDLLSRANNFDSTFFKRFLLSALLAFSGKIRSDLTQYGGISTDMGKKISTFISLHYSLLSFRKIEYRV